MRKYVKMWPCGLLLAVALTLASCGGSGSDGGEMQGMDHGGAKPAEETIDTTMETDSGGMAEEMLVENGEYSDERFIDAMVPHHEGAVEMAEVALENAEHEEIRRLAEDIISSQRAEIAQLRGIREREFGSAEATMEMGEEEMAGMGMMADPREMANTEPFDRAFIDAMIPHHESAVEMASVAREETGNPEIKDLAGSIVDAQEREIAQMREWREEWYPEG